MQRPPSSPEEQLQWLVDRAAISDLQAEYGRCLDDKEFQAWQDLFTEDAVLHMPDESIRQPGVCGRGAPRARLLPADAALAGAKLYIEIDGDTARGRRYLAAAHVHDAEPVKRHADLGGWYHHEYRRTGEGWKFTQIRATFIWLAARTSAPDRSR